MFYIEKIKSYKRRREIKKIISKKIVVISSKIEWLKNDINYKAYSSILSRSEYRKYEEKVLNSRREELSTKTKSLYFFKTMQKIYK
jgi:hypothetical protein